MRERERGYIVHLVKLLPTFYISSSSHSLSDVNECATDNGGCDQNCTNTIPGHVCSCYDGFSLDDDNTTCVPNAICEDGVCQCLEGFENQAEGSGSGVDCVGKISFVHENLQENPSILQMWWLLI